MDYTTIESSFFKLRSYVEEEEYKGWDPYDGLNSRFFRALPGIKNLPIARLGWIQLFKRSPMNLRPLFAVEKGINSKGLGLFLSGYCSLYKMSPSDELKSIIFHLADEINRHSSEGYSGKCWGYNFDWQARAFFQPKFTPTVVASTYIGCSLLDAYDIFGEERWLRLARSACDFILKDLNRTADSQGDFAFSYSPLDKTQVFNATLLASRLLSRVYVKTGGEELVEAASSSVRYACKYQKDDGSWPYGTLPFHQWIDNFHTGFNLECISDYIKYTGDTTVQKHLDLGLRFYLDSFFTSEGKSKYYHNATYPIDIHGPAQLLVTACKLGIEVEHRQLVETVLNWTLRNMQDESGFFYHQIRKGWNSKVPYMRWAQAWMFHALAMYLKSINKYQNAPKSNTV